MKLSLRLNEEDARHRAIIRWLKSQDNMSAAAVEALDAHVNGAGISLASVNDKLDRVLRLLESGVVGVGVGASSGNGGASDGLGFLDELGL